MQRLLANHLIVAAAVAWTSFSVNVFVWADEPAAKPQRSKADRSDENSARAARLYSGFDGYARRITTQSEAAQRWFDQGIQLLYGYNHDEAIRSFEKAAEVDPSCAIAWWGSAYARGLHINNPQMTEEQSRLAHDGQVATRLGLPGIPVCAETVALSTILILVRETGARVHFARLSSADGVGLVKQAKAEGLPVSCDAAVHHVHLTEMDVAYFDPNCHLTPPLRTQRDRDALRAGLADGTIDAICSDHTPVDEDAKQLPFAEAEAGATALELLLPLTLKWADESKTALLAALAKITEAPARVLGVNAGQLSAGQVADVCVFDPEQYWKVEPDALRSQGKNSPFLGFELKGRVRYTLVEGQVVYEAK